MLLRTTAFASAVLCVLLYALPSHAQVTRYVSGSGGGQTDCSYNSPCFNIGTAVSLSAAGDSVVCVTPQQAQPIKITISISIDCTSARAPIPGRAYFLASDGVSTTIVINAPGGGVVHLRGLHIDLRGVNARGIDIQAAAAVYIEDCVISSGKQGILDHRTGGQTTLFIKNTVLSDNSGSGLVVVQAAVGSTVLDNVTSERNTYGIAVGTGNNVEIRNSVFSGNSVAGIEGDPGSHVVVSGSTISQNNVGLQGTSSIRISDSYVSFNTTAFSGQTATLGLNRYSSNTSMGTPPSTVTGAPADVGP